MLLRSLFVCFLLATLNKVVLCNHFGYGTISWSEVGNYTYQINFESAWRTDYPYAEGTPTTTVGSPGNTIAIGNVYFGTTLFNVPNGPTWSASVQVMSILPNGYFIGQASTTVRLTRLGNWYVWYPVCCRSDALQLNNGATEVKITAVIPPSAIRSPVITGFPFNVFPMGTSVTYTIPAFSPLNNPLTYSFFTSPTYTGLVNNPGISGPHSFNNVTGQLTWVTPACCAGNQYAYQFVVMDTVTSAYIVVDGMFELGPGSNTTTDNATTITPTISPATTSMPTTSSQATTSQTSSVQPTFSTTTWTPPSRSPTTPTSGVGILSFTYSYSFFDLIFTSSSINVSPSQAVYDVLVPSRSLLKGVTVQLDASFLEDNHIAGLEYYLCPIGTPSQQCANQPLFGITVCAFQIFQCSSSAVIPVSERDVVVNIQLGQQQIQVSVYDNA